MGLLAAIWVSVIVWGGAVSTWFTADDVVSLARAAGLEPTPLSFRPLSAIVVWRIEYALFGLRPFGYHVTALALHCLSVAAVHRIAVQLGGGGGAAIAAAILFGAAGIAFTPLHSASCVGDLFTLVLLLAATWSHLDARRRVDSARPWASAGLAFLAVLAKESALAWPVVIVGAEYLGGLGSPTRADGTPVPRARAVLPALVAGVMGASWIAVGLGRGTVSPSGAYEVSWVPSHLLTSLSTYLVWVVEIGVVLRDRIAGPDTGALPLGLLLIVGLTWTWLVNSRSSRLLRFGLLWLVGFLLPVLPLRHHSYLYYLYVPWAGGALAAVGLFTWAATRVPPGIARVAAVVLMAGFVIAEGRGVAHRERATLAHLPADPTMRDAELLRNAISALQRERLPSGTAVGFVNPEPAARFNVATGESTTGRERSAGRPYYPLQSVMEGGRTLRVFMPQLRYAGFSDTIPSGWRDIECFLFEQRGYLRRWGKGPEALLREADWMRRRGAAPVDSVR